MINSHLVAHHLFTAQPHIFVSKTNPLAKKDKVQLADLEDFPYLSYDQGTHNSFLFLQREILSQEHHKKSIVVSDRATLFNLLIDWTAIPSRLVSLIVTSMETILFRFHLILMIRLSWLYIQHEKTSLSKMGERFIEYLLEEVRLIANRKYIRKEKEYDYNEYQ